MLMSIIDNTNNVAMTSHFSFSMAVVCSGQNLIAFRREKSKCDSPISSSLWFHGTSSRHRWRRGRHSSSNSQPTDDGETGDYERQESASYDTQCLDLLDFTVLLRQLYLGIIEQWSNLCGCSQVRRRKPGKLDASFSTRVQVRHRTDKPIQPAPAAQPNCSMLQHLSSGEFIQ